MIGSFCRQNQFKIKREDSFLEEFQCCSKNCSKGPKLEGLYLDWYTLDQMLTGQGLCKDGINYKYKLPDFDRQQEQEQVLVQGQELAREQEQEEVLVQ